MLPGLTQQRRAAILSRTLWTRPEIEIRLLTGYDGLSTIICLMRRASIFLRDLRKRLY